MCLLSGRVALSVGHLTHKSEVLVRYPVWQHTFVSPSADSRRAVVSYWRKPVHEVLVNHLGGLSLPRKSVARLTNHPDMTLDVYHGRKTTTQQQSCVDYIYFPKFTSSTQRLSANPYHIKSCIIICFLQSTTKLVLWFGEGFIYK